MKSINRLACVLMCSGSILLPALSARSDSSVENAPRSDGKIVVPRYSVLTDNADADELIIQTGVTYTAQPAFNYPADPDSKRLIDTDGPVLDATKRAGVDGPAQTLTFDLRQPYHIEEVALHFRFPQKPNAVTLSISSEASGSWLEKQTLELKDQPDEWWRFGIGPARQDVGRFIKLDFTGPKTGWNINEVKIYGSSIQQVQGAKHTRDQLVLAEKNQPRATIVLAERTRPNALRAAQLFQSLTQRMTGAQLPIVSESRFDGRTTPILIGDSTLARKYGVAVEQTPFGDDRYVMQGGGRQKFLALVGNDVVYGDPASHYGQDFRGSLFAVYDFFERQGCGWFGPDELWQVIPKTGRVSTPALAVTEIPAFKWRRIWMSTLPPKSPLRAAWRQGGTEIAARHNYNALVSPEKYKASHPEWFGDYQPDITNPEVIAVAVETLGKEIEARPNQPLYSFPVSANDGGGFKEKPFNPEVGNIAAQQLYFANEIARGLRARYPGRHFTLGTLGYWYSHRGPEPMLKAEPEVVVLMVNEGNHAKPVTWPESAEVAQSTGRNNTREMNAFRQWKQTGGLKGIYEWWIPAISNITWQEIPWYDGSTAVSNLRYWHRNGIRYVDYESQKELNDGFPLRWAQYYIGARAMWNPDIDPHQELLQACRKLFGAAANTMLHFYSLQERAMRETKELVGNWALPLPHLLYTPQIEDEGEALLLKALAQEKSGEAHTRIAIETKQWMRLRELNAKARAENQKVFEVIVNGVSMNWNKQFVDLATVVDLADLPAGTKLQVLERDGQNRTALKGETYDLESGVTFRTITSPEPKTPQPKIEQKR